MLKINSLKTIIVSIIESVDKYNFLLKAHHRRTATIAYQLGCEFGLNPKEISNVVLTASIHDIGALHVSERDKLLYIDAEDTAKHEKLGEKIIMGFKPFKYISKIIRHHHVKYDEWISGKYQMEEIPFESFFIHLADRIDVLLVTHESDDNKIEIVIREINNRFGTTFHPELKNTFNFLAETDDFWTNIEDQSYNELLMMSLENDMVDLNNDDLESLASLFARIVDFKSKWTTNHSKSVGMLAYRIAEIMELPAQACFELKIAGYFHDVGKIAIPSEILEKSSSLSNSEYNTMKSHVKYSSLILSKIDGLGNIAKWAISHHEKRDRSGYPLKRSLNDFTIEMDILAFSDIISALGEDRPYRDAMTQEESLIILKSFIPEKLDESVYNAIEKNYEELYSLNREIGTEYTSLYKLIETES